ncbi:nitrous oxide-stimulated promoter family protein, partial [Longicatena caecimuris]|nr:nitrous oxide-stimulated promoter family protein [Longicatena caecimuris]
MNCYRKEQRDKIKEVMRFSLRYMLLYHPLMALRDMINT